MEPNKETIAVLTEKYDLSPEQVNAILQEHCGKPASSKNMWSADSYSDHSDYSHHDYPSGVN